MLETAYLLNHEKVNFKNYPELRAYKAQIQEIKNYTMQVSESLDKYHNGFADKIDLTKPDIEHYIALCREVLEWLGNRDNPCIDVIIQLREFNRSLNELLFLKKEHGDRIIGTPKASNGGEVV